MEDPNLSKKRKLEEISAAEDQKNASVEAEQSNQSEQSKTLKRLKIDESVTEQESKEQAIADSTKTI